MCITAIVAGLAVAGTVGSMFSTYVSESANARVQNDQLKAEMAMTKVEAAQQTRDRLRVYREMSASNRLAAMVNVGGGTNLSFEQAIEPYNWGVMQEDLSRIQYNADQSNLRRRYGIQVNKQRVRNATITAGIDTAASFASQAAGGYINRVM